MKVSLLALALAAFVGLCGADKMNVYTNVGGCSGTPDESYDFP
jgi:hypothetical protein